jgi:hypothetical protein
MVGHKLCSATVEDLKTNIQKITHLFLMKSVKFKIRTSSEKRAPHLVPNNFLAGIRSEIKTPLK